MENPQILHQMHQGSAKVCEVDMVGEEWEVGETLVVVSSVTRSV